MFGLRKSYSKKNAKIVASCYKQFKIHSASQAVEVFSYFNFTSLALRSRWNSELGTNFSYVMYEFCKNVNKQWWDSCELKE